MKLIKSEKKNVNTNNYENRGQLKGFESFQMKQKKKEIKATVENQRARRGTC